MLDHVNGDAAPDGMYTLPPRPFVLDLEFCVFVIGGARYRLKRLPDAPPLPTNQNAMPVNLPDLPTNRT
jgi:hypothetical protein